MQLSEQKPRDCFFFFFTLDDNGEQQEIWDDMKNVFGWIHTQGIVIKRVGPPDWTPKVTKCNQSAGILLDAIAAET